MFIRRAMELLFWMVGVVQFLAAIWFMGEIVAFTFNGKPENNAFGVLLFIPIGVGIVVASGIAMFVLFALGSGVRSSDGLSLAIVGIAGLALCLVSVPYSEFGGAALLGVALLMWFLGPEPEAQRRQVFMRPGKFRVGCNAFADNPGQDCQNCGRKLDGDAAGHGGRLCRKCAV